MPETRKLRTILFADIVGYTAMMQQDEQHSLHLLAHFKADLERLVPAHEGDIIQYFGDACLLSFESATQAVACALAMQTAYREKDIPVRIGMHLGEVMFRENNAYGDGVNIASRVESMGIPGSVIVSRTVREQVKNKAEFSLAPLGAFHFKNVEAPMELYALANEGLVVPQKGEMKGKLAETVASEKSGFFQQLWEKRIPQVLIAYLLIAWVGVQLIDWAMDKSGLSPYWSRIFLITLIGLIPSLMVYLQHRERIHRRQFKLREKILFPANLLVVGIVLFFMFRTAELGATTTNITFLNADGEEETLEIVREEFRKSFPLFPFEPMDDSARIEKWLTTAVPVAGGFILSQDRYLSPTAITLPPERVQKDDFFSMAEKIERAQLFTEDFYVDGEYGFEGGQVVIFPTIRDRKTGEVLREMLIREADWWAAWDSLGHFIRGDVGLTQAQMKESLILGTKEGVSDNLEALKAYALSGITGSTSYLEKSLALDSTNMFPALGYAQHLYYSSSSSSEAKNAIGMAMRHRKRAPYQVQIQVMVYKHLIYEEWDKAEKLLKIQLEIEPSNQSYQNLLADFYWRTGKQEQFIAYAKQRFEQDPSLNTGYMAMMAALMEGKPEQVIKNVSLYLNLDPDNATGLQLLASGYLHQGKYDMALKTLERITLTKPETEKFLTPLRESMEYLQQQPEVLETLARFEGKYRRGEMVIEHQVLGGQLFTRANNQRGFFIYPLGPNQFGAGFPDGSHRSEYLLDEQGGAYLIKNVKTFSDGRKRTAFFWKEDASIERARALLFEGDLPAAQAAYREVVERNPKHFYLQQALEHLDYVLSLSEEELTERMQRVVGNYQGNNSIWMEGRKIYIKQRNRLRLEILPMSDLRFLVYGSQINYEFIEEGGEIVGLRMVSYNVEQERWSGPAGYVAKVE